MQKYLENEAPQKRANMDADLLVRRAGYTDKNVSEKFGFRRNSWDEK